MAVELASTPASSAPAATKAPDAAAEAAFPSAAVSEAWNGSALGSLPADIAERMLEGSRVITLAAGEIICRNFEGQFPFLVIEGLIRYYLQDARGRQVSINYRGAGDTANLMTGAIANQPELKLRRSWSEESGMHHAWEAIRETTILQLSGSELRAASRHDVDSAWVLVNHLMTCVALAQVELAGDILLPVQSRLARHLLNLAERQEGRLVVCCSNQDLADAIGSVRDVTSRVLGTMARSGMIARERRRLILLKPAELHDIAIGRSLDEEASR